MDDCIFCKIIKGKIPCFKVYEDDKYVAFLDIFPRAKGHTVVIPKKHVRWVTDLSQEEFGDMWKTVHTVTRKIASAIKPLFTSYLTYGLDVTHAHIHILPRESNDGFIPEAVKGNMEELKKVADLINGGN